MDSNNITRSFERFNSYAREAVKEGDDSDVYALLAIAFELSQLRYMFSKGKVDDDIRRRVS